MKYKSIFFDLDHTLWDYESNSRETLLELHHEYGLADRGITAFDDLHATFNRVNLSLWDLYDRGKIESDVIRRERFLQILAAFDIADDKLCADLSRDYLHRCPSKCNLIPDAIETLEYLSGRYKLTVVTNGFEEIQHVKLCSGKLLNYFDHVVTSQRAGHKKPAREIFEYALQLNDTTADGALMIGDNPVTDIGGARNASIDCVFFNPAGVTVDAGATYEIQHLSELRRIV